MGREAVLVAEAGAVAQAHLVVHADALQERARDAGAGGGGAGAAEARAEALEQLLGEEVVARLVHGREHAAQGGRALRARERRGDGSHRVARRVHHADAGRAQALGERARGAQRRVVHVAARARVALVEGERRERAAVGQHARPPVGHLAQAVEVALVGHHAAGDARHSQGAQAAHEVLHVAGLHAPVPPGEGLGGERRVAEPAQVDVALDDPVGVGTRVEEDLRAEAVRGRPGGERGRRGDQLLVGGRPAQHVRPQLVQVLLGGEVEDGDRRARAGHTVLVERRGDAARQVRRGDARSGEEQEEDQAREQDERPGAACSHGGHGPQR